MTAIVRRENTDYVPSFGSFFNEFFNNDSYERRLGADRGSFVPAVNIKETENDFQISFVAPGMKKENFEIVLDKDMLSVSGNVEEKQEEEEGTYSRMEYNFKSFKRSFTLPLDKVLADKMEAKYQDGVLSLVIPKKEEAKPQPAKTIQVK